MAFFIHQLISNDNVNLEILTDSSLEEINDIFNSLLNNLVKDENSNLLSKFYFRKYLADKLSKFNTDYQGVYFTTSGIKISNTAYDHAFTDYRLNKTAKNLINNFLEYREYNNIPFSEKDTDTFFISQGAGNFLALIPQSDSLNIEEVNKIIDSVNSHADITSTTSSLLIASATIDNISKNSSEEFLKSVRSLKQTANSNKDDLKKYLFNSIDLEECFKKCIYPCLTYYKRYIPDGYTSIKKQSLFINNITKSLLDYCVIHNKKINSLKNIER